MTRFSKVSIELRLLYGHSYERMKRMTHCFTCMTDDDDVKEKYWLINNNMKNSSEYVRLQINKVTSWIDGSFIYSSSEAWANTMRAFKNGSLLMEPSRKFPVRNTMRAPLFNHAVPHVMRMLSPERLYRKITPCSCRLP